MRTISGATSQERRAAERLGAVYLELEARKVYSLDMWAIPLAPALVTVSVDYKREFYASLAEVYDFDLDRKIRAHRARIDILTSGTLEIVELQRRYRPDYYLLVPALIQSSAVFAKKCLDAEIVALSRLLADLTEQSSVAESLHVASSDILAAARNAAPQAIRKKEAARAGLPEPTEDRPEKNGKGYNISYLTPTEVRQIFRELARSRARYAGDHLIEILLEHPEGVTILEEYAASSERGTIASTTRVLEALGALGRFSQSAIQEGKYLRYPFFVMGGVFELNLHRIPGFIEYAVQITQILAKDWRESALSVGAVAVGCFALAFGPAAPAVALLLLAGTDLALSGMALGLAFMRERERDLGSQASGYRRDRFATPAVYGDTAFAGVSALISAIAFFGAGASQLRKVLGAPARPVPASSPPTRPRPLFDDGLTANRVRETSLAEARATTPKQTGVPQAASTAFEWMAPPPRSPQAARTRADMMVTQGASGIGPGSRARTRPVSGSPSFDERAGQFRRDLGTSGVPDRARPMAVGAIEEPAESVSAISKPAFGKATGETGADVIPIASASRTGGGPKPPPAPQKAPSVAQTGPATRKGIVTSKEPKAGVKGKVTPSAMTEKYSRRKAAENIVLKNEEEIWSKREDYRGLYIQSRLAKTDYKDYGEPLLRYRDEIDEWFPFDFVSRDSKHAVSLKTYNPMSKSALEFQKLQEHVKELVEADFRRFTPFERVTLDVRVPPGTAQEAMNNVRMSISEYLGRGTGLDLVVKPWP